MRSARGDVRAHIVYPRTTTDLRIGFSGHCTATNTLIHVTVARLWVPWSSPGMTISTSCPGTT